MKAKYKEEVSVGQRTGKIALILIGIFLGIVFIAPFLLILINSFKTKTELFKSAVALPTTFNLDNYKLAFERLDFIRSFGMSLFITTFSIVLIVVCTSMAAWMLQRTKSKLSNGILMLFVVSMIIPFQAVMLPLVRIMGKLNLLNAGGLIFMYLGFQGAMSIFLYHGFLKNIPRELDEAAMIDGCTSFQTFRYIIFPLLKPITVTVAILNLVAIWNDYLLPSLVINGKNPTIPLKTFLFFGEYTKQWHLALAGLVIAILPVVIFYFFAQKQVLSSMVEGSVK
jgi:raffinose/stachyose/melibiose transport system permease protein